MTAPSVFEGARSRRPVVGDGKSGSVPERVVRADGTTVVVKRISRRHDWFMRAMGDDGRAARLWTDGVYARVPPVLDHAVTAVEPDGDDGWLLVMRDVGRSLVPDGHRYTVDEVDRLLAALTALHRSFAGEVIDGLCTLADRLALLTPTTARRTDLGDNPLRALVLKGWADFADVVDADVRDAVLALVEDAAPLVAALERRPLTLVHGDVKSANLGLSPDAVIALDWGTFTGMAPAALDVAWFLALDGSCLPVTGEELIARHAAVAGDLHDVEATELALLAVLLQLGWNKAMDAVGAPDPVVRAREAEGLRWWTARVRRGLELLG